MTVEIRDRRKLLATGVVLVLLALGVLGRWMTPYAHGEAQVLTPARWHALRLAKRAEGETAALLRDAQDLQALLERGRPSAVDAMLLAERVYTHHRTGTAATAAAREALIAAAEVVARHTAGTASRTEAEAAVKRAFSLIRGLREGEGQGDVRQMFPYIEVSTLDRSRP